MDAPTNPVAPRLDDRMLQSELLDRLAASALVMRAAERDAGNTTHQELFHDATVELREAIVQLRLLFSSRAPGPDIDLTEEPADRQAPSAGDSRVNR